jgi:hypothetical protein
MYTLTFKRNGSCRRVFASCILACSLVQAAAVARADDAVCAQQEQQAIVRDKVPAAVVIPQLASSSYGVAEEKHPLTLEIRAFIDKDASPARLATALRTLAMRVKDGALYGPQDLREAFAANAQAAAADVAREVPSGKGSTSPIPWQIEEGRVRAVPNLNLIGVLNSACPAGSDPAGDNCQNGIKTAKAWLRAAQLADAALSRYTQAFLDALLARSTQRLAMWHAYRDEALPQYPWEWLINSYRLNKGDKGPKGRERDANGQPIGPMNVPTDQIIFLHPGVGLEYRDRSDKEPAAGTTADSKTAPIVYLEFLGRYRWSWDATTGKMIGGNGISLVGTYADRENDTEVGYGLMFHSRQTKTYTLGITRSGDTTNVIFNADLAEFFKDKLSYWRGVEARIDEVKASLPN